MTRPYISERLLMGRKVSNQTNIYSKGIGSVVVNLLFIVTHIVEFCNCSMVCCAILCFHSSFAIILLGKRELVALLILSCWYLVMDEWLFLAVPRVCLQFIIVVFPDHTYLIYI